MSLFPNKFAGACATCSTKVGAKAGFAFRGPSGWQVCCNSDKCVPADKLAGLADQKDRAERKELTAEGEIFYPYDPDALPILRSFPGARWNADKKCRVVSLDPQDRPRVLELATKLGLTVAVSLTTIEKDPAVEQARARAEGASFVNSDGETCRPYPFQVEGVAYLALRQRAIMGDDMGLGKTVQVLLALDPNMGAIVICPASVKYNWRDECARWRPDLAPVVVSGRDNWHWPKAGEVTIINFEILPKWLLPVVIGEDQTTGREIKAANIHPNDMEKAENCILAVDEAHRVKGYKTQQHKKVKELSRICAKTWFVTGTPLLSRPTDLYGVLQAGMMDREVFGGWKGFVRCFNGYKGGYGYEWGEPTAEVPERMRRVMLRRLKTEVLKELPAKQYQTLVVNGITGSLEKTLDAMWAEHGDLIRDKQLPPFRKIAEIRAKLAKARIPAMLDLVEQYEDAEKPLVVFSAHKAPIEALAERDGWEIITGDISAAKRRDIVESFQAGKLKGIGLTIQAGGVGITLTQAASVLFVDLDWTPALNIQAEDRVCRIGQKAEGVHVIRLVSNHALDIHVQDVLAAKMAMIEKAIEGEAAAPTGANQNTRNLPTVNHESDDDFQARMDAIQAAADRAEREAAKERVVSGGWTEGERGKASRPEVAITTDVADKIRNAMGYMMSVCDGAHAKDDQGFNKPDAGRARILLLTGLTTDGELRAAERILSRYHRQLSGSYPELFT